LLPVLTIYCIQLFSAAATPLEIFSIAEFSAAIPFAEDISFYAERFEQI
jgi:hypothetical protein